MKKLLGILVLIFALQTPSWADDIRDFQIEGMSIGDSALDFFSREEIIDNINNENTFEYKDRKFVQIGTFKSSFEINQECYHNLQVFFKMEPLLCFSDLIMNLINIQELLGLHLLSLL